jgi:branched-chain amino acid transport system ATP-binding protein
MLNLKDVNCFYGKSHILHNTNLEVREKELAGLVGRNGVGKTTTLKAIMGLVPPKSGEVRFDQSTLSKLPSYQIPRQGIAYVPQGRHLFPKLTVMENLRIPIVQGPLDQGKIEEVFDYFPRLKERVKQKAGTLSGGEQQMLAMARALMARPKVLVMDEPSMGLAPVFVEKSFQLIQDLNRRGIAILLVEQNANMALAIANRGYVLQNGHIVLQDTAQNLINHPMMRKAYLEL